MSALAPQRKVRRGVPGGGNAGGQPRLLGKWDEGEGGERRPRVMADLSLRCGWAQPPKAADGGV